MQQQQLAASSQSIQRNKRQQIENVSMCIKKANNDGGCCSIICIYVYRTFYSLLISSLTLICQLDCFLVSHLTRSPVFAYSFCLFVCLLVQKHRKVRACRADRVESSRIESQCVINNQLVISYLLLACSSSGSSNSSIIVIERKHMIKALKAINPCI